MESMASTDDRRVVLIANRGEIALRVIRTCRRLGIATVAVHTELDADALHVRAADRAVGVESYLDVDDVVAAGVSAGATDVHPGYGFLSERAGFARAVEAAGLAFIGPSADVMDAMGRKDAAREVAIAAGVPVVPAYALDDDPGAMAYPVLVKAAAGGGGKGMRIVRAATDLAAATAAAAREARSAFGDDTLLIEKYVERGRHIEVQVLADSDGHVVHLFERDCSTQRRHQKVLEEAPAPTLDATQRRHVCDAAVALAREVGYVNAGTVEFLLDEATGEAYFLEMNTRLQVEHPVTEAITGLDLVEWQLRIAAGETLGFTQSELSPSGHAIEARVYAEDAFGDFLPQAGTATLVRWPTNARVDHALESGQVVSTAYDPMLGKVIVHAPTREAARRALVEALDETAILGLTTNVGFLRALADSEVFASAEIDTAWLDRHSLPAPDAEVARQVVAWVSAMLVASDRGHPFQADGFRVGAGPAPTIVELDRPVRVDRIAATVDGIPFRQLSVHEHVVWADVDGQRVRATVNVQSHIAEVSLHGQRFVFDRPDPFGDHAAEVGDGTVVAPMPGTLLEVRVAVGDHVDEGTVLGMMEAMKMELSLTAPFAGTVAEVDAAVGARVALGLPLFVIDPSDPAGRHREGSL